ncbi:valyl-tRNA synthetase [Rhizoclosmatium globosum]|uniref:Probable valine--tRNA ligase, cytoplasmic n=1 Tax=Rhizoclosmatium globosum TaxID=329046 RepID=A0A1Y2BT19_9FUNG|nr:valyl-tRNA synthetase [Rhizoclosmatium globosum]|eukprot:ORY37912.1 valyl-tRNA synthetase [Rhizoclosmatium globosum]
MTVPFAAAYNPVQVEAAWYSWWEKSGFFKPELINGEPRPEGTFVISIPPPNVTGSLHLGHALTNSIQDTLTRWNRMLGKTTLYVPGCDHAGIATQIVVEKKLMKERNLTRHDLGREVFVKEIWKWKNEYGDKIYNQIRRLGTSVDWDRAAFTMDPGPSAAVTEAFVRLHEEGVIYRENRLVNWCTKLKTAISNLEVENMELTGSTFLTVPDHDPKKKYEFGVIVSFAYKFEGSDEEIVVATTRLETMLGDTAIAVNPTDERYKSKVGKFVVHPFNGRKIPIIADDYVDKDFGTGAVKITPSHDQNDYAMGKRHNLPFINIFTDDGKVNEEGGDLFTGLQRFDARVAILEALKERGLYKETKPNPMQLPICTRSNNVVEPLMKPQWWVDCKDMAAKALEAVKSGELEIIPKTSEKDWFLWLEKIQDWCISRQLWWGHRVPAYFIKIKGQENDAMESKYWVSGRSEAEALEKAHARFPNVAKKDIILEQDPDVLDTWFSSGLWPFSIQGWPQQTLGLKHFYPNAILETGWDILFFWVARMVMMGIKLTGKVPFKQVFCHAMVRDAHGRKMSKSLGNVIDPLDVINGTTLAALQKSLEGGNLDPREVKKAQEGQAKDFPNGIPQCGTDALRFTLLNYSSGGRDINLDVLRIEGYRKFCNKLWNAVLKMGLDKLGAHFIPQPAEIYITGKESLADLWILHKLNIAARETNKALEDRNFMQATNVVYNFWMYELCDVYLEICKPVLAGTDEVQRRACRDTLYTCLDAGLKLLHPMMPFVTEELWQRLPRRDNDPLSKTIMKAKFPVEMACWNNPQADADFENVNKVVRAARVLLADYNIKKEGQLFVQTKNEVLYETLQTEGVTISTGLIKGAKSLKVLSQKEVPPAGCAVSPVSGDCNVYLLVKGMVDFDAEITKLQASKAKAATALADLTKKMSAADYKTKVKQEVQETNSSKKSALETELETLSAAIKNFEGLKNM